jgi:hypothetical protein
VKTDALISTDLQQLAAATARSFPAVADTGRDLQAQLARRGQRTARRSLRKPVVVGMLATSAAALVVPVPYRHQVGWEATFHTGDGRDFTVHLTARSASEAERRAAALALSMGAEVRLNPRTELVWGSVYALAKEKLFHIDVEMKGKKDADVEAEIRAQLAQQGWLAGDVAVQRGDGTTMVELGAQDGEGHHIQLMKQVNAADANRLQIEPQPIDDKREPGMTDEQLRDKISAQLRARGFNADVKVEGDRILIRATKHAP